MKVYLDTSVILRVLFHEPRPIRNWGKWKTAFSSRLWLTEASRTIDRLRLQGTLTDGNVAELRRQVDVIHEALHVIPVTDDILARAGEAFPTVVGTLDALHLASALAIMQTQGLDRFLTHDSQMATAAGALGFSVEGI